MVLDWQSYEPDMLPASPTGWRGQTWYLVLLGTLWDFFKLIAPAPDLILRPTDVPMETVPQLAMWPVSGKIL